jgi:ankyrin repeat protein
MSTFGTAMGWTSLYKASSDGRLDIVRFLIDQGANIHIGDNNDSSPLHIADTSTSCNC